MTERRAAPPPRKPVPIQRQQPKPHETLPDEIKRRPLENLNLAHHRLHGHVAPETPESE